MRDDVGSMRPLEGLLEGRVEDSCTVLPGRADAGILVVCDHASNAIPEVYGSLGLPAGQLERHIAYDIGAAAVTRLLASALNAPAVLSHYSRLLIDPNRGADDPTLIMRLSDGAVIPGNRHLSETERQTRIARYWRPYHQAIDGVIDSCLALGVAPAIVSIHSFTDVWRGTPRPWHAGILWDKDDRLVAPLLAGLRADPALVVGDNEPYTGRLYGDCMWQHGTRRGLAHAIVEIRQDLIRETSGQAAWAERLCQLIGSIMADTALRSRLSRIEPDETQCS
jgi:predicted N-formylglutamate amidohydrolase